jgi:serine/threonine protein kinase
MRDSERAADFEEGHVVAERYEILEAIGRGTTGVVYRARDLHVDSEHEIVALKAIHPHLHSDRQIFGRFRREVEILRKFDGPHLCKLLDCIEDEGLLLISLEYVAGPSLESYIEQRSPLPLSEVSTIVAQMCAALDKAHAAGVIHRDLKPSNVLIEGAIDLANDDGEASTGEEPPASFLTGLSVRVVDFGLAKMIRGDHTGTALTEQDMIFGTPDYMAPEQVSGEDLDGRCDVYSAGVILYEMVVGKLPFDTPGPLTTMTAHLNTPVPVPSSVAPERGLTRVIERVLLKALSKNREDRFETPGALADAFGHALVAVDEEEEDQSLETASTALEHAVSTTMASHRDSELERAAAESKGVQIKVRDAPHSSERPSSRNRDLAARPSQQAGDGERRFWTLVALAAALAAVVFGILLGVRP